MSESERSLKRAEFLAWANEGGDPGGNVLAGGPPVTRDSLGRAKKFLTDQNPTERQVFALAAKFDAIKQQENAMKVFGVTASPCKDEADNRERYVVSIMGDLFTILKFDFNEMPWVGYLNMSHETDVKYIYGGTPEECIAKLEKVWSESRDIHDWSAEREYNLRLNLLSNRIRILTEQLQHEELQVPKLKKAALADGVNIL